MRREGPAGPKRPGGPLLPAAASNRPPALGAAANGVAATSRTEGRWSFPPRACKPGIW